MSITLDDQEKFLDYLMARLTDGYNDCRYEHGKEGARMIFPDAGKEYNMLGAIRQTVHNSRQVRDLNQVLIQSKQ